jgi:hypothetical protein
LAQLLRNLEGLVRQICKGEIEMASAFFLWSSLVAEKCSGKVNDKKLYNKVDKLCSNHKTWHSKT